MMWCANENDTNEMEFKTMQRRKEKKKNQRKLSDSKTMRIKLQLIFLWLTHGLGNQIMNKKLYSSAIKLDINER